MRQTGALVTRVTSDTERIWRFVSATVIEVVLAFLMLIATTATYFRPLKILVPLAAVVFLAGLVKGAIDVFAVANLKTSDLLLLIGGIQIFALALLADLISKRR